MKTNAIITILLLCMPWHMASLSAKRIHLTFNEKDFQIENRNRYINVSTSKYDYRTIPQTQTLALPYICVNLLVSPDYEYAGFTYAYKENKIREDVLIVPRPILLPTILQNSSLNNISEKSFLSLSDSSLIYSGTHIMDGYKYISFAICPFRYDSMSKCLFLRNEIDIDVYSLESDNKQRPPSMNLHGGTTMRDIVRNIVVNSEEMDSLYAKVQKNVSKKNNYHLDRSGNDYDYEYLIITNETLKASFQRLADWKTQKGIRTKVITVENIDSNSNYTGSYQQLRIKQAIKSYYDNSQYGLKYVLLGGDEDIIPPHLAHVELTAFHYLFGYINHVADGPADLFYGCLNTMEWSGNDYYGISANVDKTPEVFLTRVPVNNINQTNAYVNRIIEYERSFDTDDWEGKILMSGNQLSDTFHINGNVISDAHHHSELLYDNYIKDYWGGQKIRFYDTGTDFDGDENYELNAQNFQIELAKGYPFVNVNTHGNYDNWNMEGANYTVSNASTLNNPDGYTLITTEACLTNAFDSLTCLSESFFRNPYSGIIGYFGSSRYGWYYKSRDDLGPSDILNGNFYKYLFTEGKSNYGYITTLAKNTLVEWSWLHTADAWLLWMVNPLGDPEMPIYTSAPRHFDNVTLSFRNDSLIVNTGIDTCRVCMMSLFDNGATYYDVQDVVSQAHFSPPADSCSICITKTGYVPYIRTYYDTIYVQNETFDGENKVFAKNIIIGKDVTSTKPEGPVVVSSGTTSFTGNNIVIRNNFEVTSGASLRVGN